MDSTIKVNIKWGKQTLTGIEVESNESVLGLKGQLFSITNVPVDKQKLVFKGTSLTKEEASLTDYKIVDGATLLMTGTALEKPELTEPFPEKKFIEELSNEELAKLHKAATGESLPYGLTNIGNTCYLNSTLQCLRRINELRDSLEKYRNTRSQDPQEKLAAALKRLFADLENKGETINPTPFINVFFEIFPQFSEMEPGGRAFRQQDADECFQSLLESIYPTLSLENLEGETVNLIDHLFRIDFETEIKNTENPEEPSIVSNESQRKLACIIDNQGNPVDHLPDGIKAGLEESIEKFSASLNRNAKYQKVLRINRLPPYLIVQKVRFFWRQAVANTGSEAGKAKILRNVSFPKVLDIYPFCTDKLKANLDEGRAYEKKRSEEKAKDDETKFEKYKADLEKAGKIIPEDTREIFKQFKNAQNEEEVKTHDEQLYRQHGLGLETGNYELIAVLTHKGRSADSGHYVGWVHKKGDQWVKYDDDVVTTVKLEDVLNLRGGGDWHMAYYCIYRKLEVV